MKYLSVCSGIEAATVAWHPLGWKPVAFSEIEPFPCKVLAHHYPDVPNFGDMTKFKEWPDANVDVLVGGTPCQSFSAAGLRKGLADPRGNLMLTYLAIAAKYRPKWVVWENVPGVLSSNGGRDFSSLLRGLAELGYGFAYRVLDAQYFGVPQRRRRVFVVGCLGDWRSASAVLFERHSLQGNPAPSRKAGQEIAPTIRAGAPNGGPGHGARSGDSKDELIVPIVGALTAHAFAGGAGGRPEGAAANHFIPVETLCVATGQAGAEIGADMAPTLNCNHEAPYVVHGTQDPCVGDPAFTLQGAHHHAVAFKIRGGCENDGKGYLGSEDAAFTLSTNQDQHLFNQMQVRRLTPRECERLQGFPDDYTLIPTNRHSEGCAAIVSDNDDAKCDCGYKSKPAADGPRYKALGNSFAVPVVRWVGMRIQMVEDACSIAKAAA